jgi:hypothetical protein
VLLVGGLPGPFEFTSARTPSYFMLSSLGVPPINLSINLQKISFSFSHVLSIALLISSILSFLLLISPCISL